MKKIMILFTFFAVANVSAAGGGLAYVEFERIYSESKIVNAVRDDIDVEFSDREKALTKLNEQIETLRAEIEKEALTLSDAEKRSREQEVAALEREFVRDRRTLGEDLSVRFQERRRVIDNEIERIIKEIAKEREYSMVVNPYIILPTANRSFTHNIILYADESIDITSDVIKVFDSEARISR